MNIEIQLESLGHHLEQASLLANSMTGSLKLEAHLMTAKAIAAALKKQYILSSQKTGTADARALARNLENGGVT